MPHNAWVRRYRARAFGDTTQAKLDRLKDGCTVEGVRYGPIEARLDKAQEKAGGGKNIWITLSLSEGKNREVRRVLESIGLKVNRLIRLSYGPFALGTLLPGQVEEVGPRVIRELLEGIVAEENMPKGDKPQFIGVADPLKAVGTAGGGDMQRRGVPRTNKAVQTSILIPEEKGRGRKVRPQAGLGQAQEEAGNRRPRRRSRRQEVDREQDDRPQAAVLSRRRRQAGPRQGAGRQERRRQARRPGQGCAPALGQRGSSQAPLEAPQAQARRAAGQWLQAADRGPAKSGGKPGGARPGGKPSTVKAAGAGKPGEPGKVWSKPGMAKSAGARSDGPRARPAPGGKPAGPRPGGSAPPRGKR
jgi:23S rRNA pseudouridine2605 synthase